MSVNIRPVGLLKRYAGEQSSFTLECAGKSIRDCLLEILIPSELVAMVIVNGSLQDKDYIVRDQDVIQLIPLVGGG